MAARESPTPRAVQACREIRRTLIEINILLRELLEQDRERLDDHERRLASIENRRS
jgi:hypothetical protein